MAGEPLLSLLSLPSSFLPSPPSPHALLQSSLHHILKLFKAKRKIAEVGEEDTQNPKRTTLAVIKVNGKYIVQSF
jgi:hypothetical protein